METKIEAIMVWMKLHFLQLDSTKTEAILVGTPHQVKACPTASITFSWPILPVIHRYQPWCKNWPQFQAVHLKPTHPLWILQSSPPHHRWQGFLLCSPTTVECLPNHLWSPQPSGLRKAFSLLVSITVFYKLTFIPLYPCCCFMLVVMPCWMHFDVVKFINKHAFF